MDKSVDNAFKSLESLERIELSIVVPSYNTPHLKRNIKKIIASLPNVSYEIIVVNDGSRRFPKNLDTLPGVKVINHLSNKGKGQALRTGFKIAKGEIICFIDADLQIPATLIKPYYEIMKGKSKPSILIGSKRHKDSKVCYPFIRRVYSFGFQMINRFMFGLSLLDTQSGIKFFRKEVIKEILPLLKTKGFAIDLEILSLAQRKGYKILEGPIRIKESFSSTVNILAVFRMFRDTLKIWFRFKFKNKK